MFRKIVSDGTLFHESYFSTPHCNDDNLRSGQRFSSPSNLKTVTLITGGGENKCYLTPTTYNSLFNSLKKMTHGNIKDFCLVSATEDLLLEYCDPLNPLINSYVHPLTLRFVSHDNNRLVVKNVDVFAVITPKVYLHTVKETARHLFNKKGAAPLSFKELSNAFNVPVHFLEELLINYNNELLKNHYTPAFDFIFNGDELLVKPLTKSESQKLFTVLKVLEGSQGSEELTLEELSHKTNIQDGELDEEVGVNGEELDEKRRVMEEMIKVKVRELNEQFRRVKFLEESQGSKGFTLEELSHKTNIPLSELESLLHDRSIYLDVMPSTSGKRYYLSKSLSW